MKWLEMIRPKRKRGWALWFLALCVVGVIGSCGPTKLTLTRARLTPLNQPATPPVIDSDTTIERWITDTRPQFKTLLQQEVYGFLPEQSSTRILSHRVVAETAFEDKAQIEEFDIVGYAIFSDQTNKTKPFTLVLASPKHSAPKAIILFESFCPNHNTIPHPDVSPPRTGSFSCDGDGFMSKTMRYVFGRYIATPPINAILDHGYAIGALYPSDFVPDRSENGLKALNNLSKGHQNPKTRWGAIAAWAWGFSRATDALKADERFKTTPIVSYGHSRYGKAALVAGAFDERIEAVIAHQSGTGGASLNRHKKGESVTEITNTYPHWFAQSYAEFGGHEDDMKSDQHMLLALITPRPIFLGNARRDVWSDPNGAFRAAQGASPAYKLLGKTGLKQNNLKSFIPDADISFWIRPGTHGVVKEDWPAFLAFLDAHF